MSTCKADGCFRTLRSTNVGGYCGIHSTPLSNDGITCPHCTGYLKTVLDSRPTLAGDNKVLRRRRECGTCHRRTTTYELTTHQLDAMLHRNQHKDPITALIEAAKVVAKLGCVP